MNGQTISKIEVQKNDPHRRSLFVGRRFLMGVHYRVLEALEIKVGTPWDEALAQKVELEESYYRGLKKAGDLLYRSSRTKRQMVQKLVEREYSQEVAQRIADELESRGFINDQHYAEQFIETRGHKYGSYRLRQELRVKGVSDDIINEALEQVEQDTEYNRALDMGMKRARQYAGDPSEKAYQKLTGYLSRKGFAYDIVKKVVKQILEDVN